MIVCSIELVLFSLGVDFMLLLVLLEPFMFCWVSFGLFYFWTLLSLIFDLFWGIFCLFYEQTAVSAVY